MFSLETFLTRCFHVFLCILSIDSLECSDVGLKILSGLDSCALMRNVIVDNTSVRLECTTALIHCINCIVTYTVTIASFQWYEEYFNSYKDDCNDVKEEITECVACRQSSETLCSCLATGGQVTRIAFFCTRKCKYVCSKYRIFVEK